MTRGLLRSVARALVYGSIGVFGILLVLVVRHLEARPDLQPWHLAELGAEYRAGSSVETFEAYLELERRLFAQLEERVQARVPARHRTRLNRYHRGSLADPGHWPTDWNRSFELPADVPRAAVLLLHGMSDSPYSLRALGRTLHARGAWVIGLRLPGHGAAPSGLTTLRWQDMASATRLALRHLQQRADGVPIYVIGYSTGAALAVEHAIAAVEDSALTPVAGLVLISPAIGVTPLAALAVWQARLGSLLGLPKLAWNTIVPEFDPFKYSSFAVNAGDQVHRLTLAVTAGLDRLEAQDRIGDLPPVLAFQSLADATVSSRAVVDRLFLRLRGEGHELVVFDLNRRAAAEALLRSDPKDSVSADLGERLLPFTLTFVTNESEASSDVVLRTKPAGSASREEQALGLTWPPGVFSLTHVALPFPANDPLYGGPGAPESPGIALGRAEVRGERGLLAVSPSDLMRLRWNPFYDFLEARVVEALGLGEG